MKASRTVDTVDGGGRTNVTILGYKDDFGNVKQLINIVSNSPRPRRKK